MTPFKNKENIIKKAYAKKVGVCLSISQKNRNVFFEYKTSSSRILAVIGKAIKFKKIIKFLIKR